jgi:hypothetical protein
MDIVLRILCRFAALMELSVFAPSESNNLHVTLIVLYNALGYTTVL